LGWSEGSRRFRGRFDVGDDSGEFATSKQEEAFGVFGEEVAEDLVRMGTLSGFPE
jgi:hypothetical protein